MYCPKCNNSLTGSEIYCPNCGKKITETESKQKKEPTKESTENSRSASISLGLVALFGSLLIVFAPAAFIIALVGLAQAVKSNRNVKNTPGLVINGVALLTSSIGMIIFLFFVSFFIKAISKISEIDINDYLHGEPLITEDHSEKF